MSFLVELAIWHRYQTNSVKQTRRSLPHICNLAKHENGSLDYLIEACVWNQQQYYNCFKLFGFDYQPLYFCPLFSVPFSVATQPTLMQSVDWRGGGRGSGTKGVSVSIVWFLPSALWRRPSAQPSGRRTATAASTMAIISHGMGPDGRTDACARTRTVAVGRTDDELVRHMESECATNSNAHTHAHARARKEEARTILLGGRRHRSQLKAIYPELRGRRGVFKLRLG